MIGICIELKTSCKHCSSPLMLNAFTERILCTSCNKFSTFPQETWHGLLEDAMKEAPKFKLGEGQPSTIMRGENTYSLMFGRQEPRCGKCKTGIDIAKLEEYSSKGSVVCTKCSNKVFVRKAPVFVTESFSEAKYLASENSNLLSQNEKSASLPNSAKPVLFTCPSCAGNLEIDGSDRMVTCKFCDSQIYLPDDLWFRLHPAESVERWYIIVDENAVPPSGKLPEWYYFADVTIDKNGNLYLATAEEGEEDFIVWSMDKDLNTRWIKKGLKFNYEDTGITIASDGNLYLWDKEKHSLLKLSSENGNEIKKLKGSPATKDNPYAFNMHGCGSLVSNPDGTVLALINNTVTRFDENGNRIELWSGKKLGLFSIGIGEEVPAGSPEWAPYLKEIRSYPKRMNSDYTKLNLNWDGELYMMDKSSSDGEVAKFSHDGTKLWSKFIPLNYKECKPCFDSAGNVYILGRSGDSNFNLIRLNKVTFEFETLVKDIKEGGYLNEEIHLAVAPDGTAYVFNTYNKMKVFSPEMKMIYCSAKCEEDDDLVRRRKKESVENDEEFS
jgi:DNA-directed RNA polymerase subunit RPC12/RpoP